MARHKNGACCRRKHKSSLSLPSKPAPRERKRQEVTDLAKRQKEKDALKKRGGDIPTRRKGGFTLHPRRKTIQKEERERKKKGRTEKKSSKGRSASASEFKTGVLLSSHISPFFEWRGGGRRGKEKGQ